VPTAPPRSVPPLPPVRRVSAANDRGQLPGRRKNQRWTLDEVRRLIEGVRYHGPGSWAAILDDNQDIWGPIGICDRTQVDLKDKWRNLAGHSGDKAHRNNPDALAAEAYYYADIQAEKAKKGFSIAEQKAAKAVRAAEEPVQDDDQVEEAEKTGESDADEEEGADDAGDDDGDVGAAQVYSAPPSTNKRKTKGRGRPKKDEPKPKRGRPKKQ
jgi:hypothetical protein